MCEYSLSRFHISNREGSHRHFAVDWGGVRRIIEQGRLMFLCTFPHSFGSPFATPCKCCGNEELEMLVYIYHFFLALHPLLEEVVLCQSSVEVMGGID